jgi:hypothetical protein
MFYIINVTICDFEIFLYKRRSMDIYKTLNLKEYNKTKLKKIAENMLSTFDEEQLISIIKVMVVPFYINELSDYLIDEKLPNIGSEEFNFLILANKYKGHIVRKIVKEEGISDYYLKKFINKYNLRELFKGIYIFPNKEVDYLFVLQQRYKITVISHETALYMLGLIDHIPQKITVSVPEKYDINLIRNNYAHTFYQDIYMNNRKNEFKFFTNLESNRIVCVRNKRIPETQIVEMKSNNDLPLRVTSEERAVVDILKVSYKADEEVKEQAVHSFVHKYPERIARLRRIAKTQNNLKELENYLSRKN